MNEDIIGNEGINSIHYLKGTRVNLQNAPSINNFTSFGKIKRHFKNRNKKKRIDIFACNPDLTLSPKNTSDTFHNDEEYSNMLGNNNNPTQPSSNFVDNTLTVEKNASPDTSNDYLINNKNHI